jgi:alkylhydroperoxidase/carboxymuconolactone decarboxylase family protein YurZ
MGVTEHTRCLGVVAAALLLDGLGGEPALLPPRDSAATDAPVRTLLDEIGAAHEASMGNGWIPALWRALARNVHYLESTWRKEQVVMRAGALTARDKRRVALGIAMNEGSRYMIEYNTAILRHAGDTDEDLLEVLGVVDHYNCLNTLSDGMQIPSDIRPPS